MLIFTTHATQEKIIVTWFLGIATNPQITVMLERNELSIYLILNFVINPARLVRAFFCPCPNNVRAFLFPSFSKNDSS